MKYEISVKIMEVLYLILLAYIFFNLKKKNLKKKMVLVIIFILLATPFNVLVSRIGDYNLVTAFTFIWQYKFKIFSLADILFLVLFLINIKDIFKSLFYHEIIRLYVFKHLVYILIGTISYIYMESYFLDSGKNFFSSIRGILYFYTTYYLVQKYLKEKKILKDYMNIIEKIFIFSIISSFMFKRSELWIRHGYRVTILGQEWAYGLFSFYVTYLFFEALKNRKKIKFTIYFCVLALNVYKGVMFYQIIVFVYWLFFYMKNTPHKIILKSITLLFGKIGIAIILLFIVNASSIETRNIQKKEYLGYIKNKGNYPYYLGLGIAAPYKNSGKNKTDFGEIKQIDMQKYKGYKFAIQTPYLSNLKDVGIIGIIITSILSFIIAKKKFFRSLQTKDSEFISLSIVLIMSNITLSIIILRNVYIVILYGFFLGRYVVLDKKLDYIKN